ncbi:cullin-1-like protein isoform X2, partial [Tanacetum coccineum]
AHKEAFKVFCSKGIAGSSSAELLATFFHNILKTGGSEKLSDKPFRTHLRRKLTWIYSLGTCNINGKFDATTIELIVIAYQIPLSLVDEKKKVIDDVDKDKRYAIEALIVRTMTSRKVLGYQHLVMECIEQLRRVLASLVVQRLSQKCAMFP